MIECGECGDGVSDKAQACPNCGAPVRQPAHQQSNGKANKVLLDYGALAASGLLFALSCGFCMNNESATAGVLGAIAFMIYSISKRMQWTS